jgi:hypothetical protein
MNNDTEIRKGAFPLAYAIAEQVSLPLSEIVRQIKTGLCRINGRVINDPWSAVIMGCKIELGKMTKFVVGITL